MKTLSENKCFGGVQGVYSHASQATGTDMTFGLFLPAEAQDGPVPVLWFLAGLTCTHENAMTKAGAQQWAAEQGADRLALAVTQANSGAIALYTSLGMQPVGEYHYRIKV